MPTYNQLAQEQTNYSCSVFWFLNWFKYSCWVELKVDWILKIIIYMEKIWALLSKWAYASVIYPALIKYVDYKTWLKFNIVTTDITRIDREKGRIIWFKKANSQYVTLSKDLKVTFEDTDKIIESKWWSWHFHFIKRDVIIESLGWYPYRISKEVLLYAFMNWLYYQNARTFEPSDEYTEVTQKKLIGLVKDRSSWTNYKFISYEELLWFNEKKGSS